MPKLPSSKIFIFNIQIRCRFYINFLTSKFVIIFWILTADTSTPSFGGGGGVFVYERTGKEIRGY